MIVIVVKIITTKGTHIRGVIVNAVSNTVTVKVVSVTVVAFLIVF